MPVILQTEASECGLSCLAMIANYHGHDIDLASLRQRHLIALTGSSLKSITEIAATLDLSSRPVRLDMEHLHELQLPAILHWDFNHFVVLRKVTPKHAYIIDPGLGEKKIALNEMSNHFTGVALELSPTIDFSPQTAKLQSSLSMLWSKLIGLKRALFQTLTLSVILQITVILAPLYLQIIVDGVLPSNDKKLLWALALGFGGLIVLKAVTEATRSWAILVFGNQMGQQMLGNVFSHLLRLPAGYFEKRHIGDIISRMGSAQPIQQALTQTVVAVLMDGIMATIMLIVMILYAPLLAAIVFSSVLLLATITLLIYPRLRQTQEEVINTRAIENSHIIESIRSATTLKLFGREAQRETSWRNLYTDIINANISYGRWMIWQRFAESLITGLQLIAVVYVGTTLILSQDLTGFSLGMLFAFMAFRANFTRAITELIRKSIEFRLLELHLDRLSDIVFTEQDVICDGTQSLRDGQGEIVVENLSFRYSDTGPWILKNLSLTLKAGEMTTLTGPSGGGKTTLLKLILGLYKPTYGRILIDGQYLANINISEWRRTIGVVMQDDHLLSGSILQNITLFDPEPDMERVRLAVKRAKVEDDIAKLPMKYDSLIGAMGSVLSGGQKQRVLLARALYPQPKLLFLDEGTANLDIETEREIVKTLNDMSITRVIIAHRPAFIESSTSSIVISRLN